MAVMGDIGVEVYGIEDFGGVDEGMVEAHGAVDDADVGADFFEGLVEVVGVGEREGAAVDFGEDEALDQALDSAEPPLVIKRYSIYVEIVSHLF